MNQVANIDAILRPHDFNGSRVIAFEASIFIAAIEPICKAINLPMKLDADIDGATRRNWPVSPQGPLHPRSIGPDGMAIEHPPGIYRRLVGLDKLVPRLNGRIDEAGIMATWRIG
jgi:hypothetical protein